MKWVLKLFVKVVIPRNKMALHTHVEYLEPILSLKREIETLRDRYHDINGSFTLLIMELTSLMNIVPTPSLSTPYTLCVCLTHSQYIDRISSIDARLRHLVHLLLSSENVSAASAPDYTDDYFPSVSGRYHYRERRNN